MFEEDDDPIDQPLVDNIRMIVGGVATIVAIIVPFMVVRKLVRTIEDSEAFKKLQETLS